MTTMEIFCSIAFPLAFVVALAIPFLLEICDVWQTSSWKYGDDGYKYDKIHDRRKKMNKKERIAALELKVRLLKSELEYIEHKNDKSKIESRYDFDGAGSVISYNLIYPSHKTRSIETISLGGYCLGWTEKSRYNVEILKETDKEVYIKFPHRDEEFNTIKVVNKEDKTVKEVDAQHFETLKELFETKPKKSSKKEK